MITKDLKLEYQGGAIYYDNQYNGEQQHQWIECTEQIQFELRC